MLQYLYSCTGLVSLCSLPTVPVVTIPVIWQDYFKRSLKLWCIRWRLRSLTSLLPASASTDASATITPVTLPANYTTQNQRFLVAMSILQPVASMLSGLPPAHFARAVTWLKEIEADCRSGSWDTNDSVTHSQPSAGITTADTSADMDSEPECLSLAADSTNHHVSDPWTTITTADIHPIPVSAPLAADSTNHHQICTDGNNNTDPVLLTLPPPLRQIGRPSRQRQHVIHKRAVPFEKLKPQEADHWRLKQLVSSNAAVAAVRTGRKCSQDDLPTELPVCLMSEERFQLNQLEQYFEPAAWEQLTDRFTAGLLLLDDIDWKCSACDSSTSPTGSDGRWVQCDRCLGWLHYQCVGIKRKPRNDFFCRSCK